MATSAVANVSGTSFTLTVTDTVGAAVSSNTYEIQEISARFITKFGGGKQLTLLYKDTPLISVSNTTSLSGYSNKLFGSSDPIIAKLIYDALSKADNINPAPNSIIVNTRPLSSSSDSVTIVPGNGTLNVKIADGSSSPSIKDVDPGLSDKALVVAISPNSPTINTLNTKLTDVDTKLASTNTKLTSVDTKLDNTNTKLTDVDTKLASANTKLGVLETKLTNIDVNIAVLNGLTFAAGVGSSYTETAAANTATAITLPATSGKSWIIYNVEFSYAGTPDTGATLTIAEGAVVKRRTQVTASGAGPLIVNQIYTPGSAVTVTLSAGGTDVVGSLNISAKVV